MTSFNLETVRSAWSEKNRAERAAWRAARIMEDGSYATPADTFPYAWCKEVWSDFIIVEIEGRGKGAFQKIPFSVGTDQTVTFGTPKAVKQEYVALSAPTSTLLWQDEEQSAMDRLVALAGTEKVSGHTRTTKSGKVVQVEQYFRSPGKMKKEEIFEAMEALAALTKSKDANEANRAKNQTKALQNELRARASGQSKEPDGGDAPAAKKGVSIADRDDKSLDGRISELQNDPKVNTGPDVEPNGPRTRQLKRLVQEKKNRTIAKDDAAAKERGGDDVQSLIDKLQAAGKKPNESQKTDAAAAAAGKDPKDPFGDIAFKNAQKAKAPASKTDLNHDATLAANLKKSIEPEYLANVKDVAKHADEVIANAQAHLKDGKITANEAEDIILKAESLKKQGGSKKVGLSSVFGEDSAIVRLTRKM